ITEADPPAATYQRALVREHRVRNPPPTAGRTYTHRVRNTDVGEEHLVEMRRAGDLAQRAHVDSRGAHVEEERGDALVLRRVGITARQQQAPVAVVRAGRPHLLTVDGPLVAVTLGARPQTREVGACARFGE